MTKEAKTNKLLVCRRVRRGSSCSLKLLEEARRWRFAMFHSQSLLSRKGSLGTIWLAAYFYKKLKKEEIVRTNISSSVDKILPYAGTSYRILGQLLLGVVRIFSKKVELLCHDCNETLGRISKVINLDGRRPSCKSNVASHSSKARNVFPRVTSHLSHDSVSPPQDEAIEPIISSVEAIVAPQRSTTVTIPENLTLDSFILEVPMEGDSIGAHQQVKDKGEVEDDWQHVRYEGGSSMRHQLQGADTDSDFNSACFTPVRDILWDHMMDLDIEINETHTSGIFKKGDELQTDLSNAECLRSTSTSRTTPGSVVVADMQELQPDTTNAETISSVRLDAEELLQLSTPSAKAISVAGLDAYAKLGQDNTPREDALEDFQQEIDIGTSFPEKRHLEARIPSKTRRKLIVPCPPGPASPELAVKTPAKREQRRMTEKRKRKCLIDETIVLSNQTLRESIHDSSGLIFKRTKALHTCLDIWRLYKFYDLNGVFEEPLIPYPSTEFSNHLAKKLLDSRMGTTTEAVKKSDDVKDDPHSSLLERECSCHHENAKTSFCFPGSGSWETDNERSKEPSVGVVLDLEEQDTSCNQAIRNQGGFSTRTRSVAHYLSKSFENEKMDLNETLSLSKVLEGKNKKASAVIFYETLVLKAWDCIDVTQEVPYADIIISANLKLYSI